MKILIVKTSSIGDIIQTFPVLEYLKKRHPDAEIDWVVEREYLTLAQSHPMIYRVLPFHSRSWRKLPVKTWSGAREFYRTLRKEHYDILFDLQGNTKSAFITAFARAREKVGLGWKSVAEFPNYFVTRRHIDMQESLQIQHRYLQFVKEYFSDTAPFVPPPVKLQLLPDDEGVLTSLLTPASPRIMVACASKWPNKQLLQTTLQELLQKIALQDNPHFYFVAGDASEKAVAQELHTLFPRSQVIDHVSFPLWQALMRQMDLVIAVDSAALALCGTTETPTLSFFGPSLATIYKPLGHHHTAWQGKCPYGQKFETRCPLLRTCPTGACLKSAVPDELFETYLSAKTSVKR